MVARKRVARLTSRDAPRVAASFLLSAERSGSTLLRWMLDAHPEIASPGELRLGRLAGDLYLAISRTTGLRGGELESRESIEASLVGTRRVIAGVLDEYAHSRGARLWCEKSPVNLEYLEVLAHAFPDARWICLYRDVSDVVASCEAAIDGPGFPDLGRWLQRWPGEPRRALVENWAFKTAAMAKLEHRNPATTHRVRYEDLVQNPESILAAVQSFLGVSVRHGLAESAFETEHDPGGGDRRIAETSAVETGRVGRTPRLRADELPISLVRRVNALARGLGYAELA